MRRRAFLRFLWSIEAIQAHLVFGTLIVLLSYSLWAGEAQPDYGWGLLFAICAYPVVLGLLWWQKRTDEQAVVEHLVESLTAPEQLRRKRQRWRMGSLGFFAVLACGLVYAGFQGWKIDFIPAQYLGYFFLGLTGLGSVGVNIWHGGPLDPRWDPPPPEESL